MPSWCRTVAQLFYAWDAISFTTMAAGPVSIHFVCGETGRPAGNCFATPVLVGRDATAAIVVNEMRERSRHSFPQSYPLNTDPSFLILPATSTWHKRRSGSYSLQKLCDGC